MPHPTPTRPVFPPHPFAVHSDRRREECGIYGIYGQDDAAAMVALGLHALQHRGQEAAGIVAYDGCQFNSHRGHGLVGDNFGTEKIIERLQGPMGIGHVRYSTSGDTAMRNVQPLFADFQFGGLAIAHNGNLTNAYELRQDLVSRGCIFQSTSDTETIIHLIARSTYSTVVDRMIDALKQVEGAYSLVCLTRQKLIGVRDPSGVRPLVLGRMGDSYILASESCALSITGAEYIRDVEPGEIIVIDKDGLRSIKPFTKKPSKFCIFEYIYFARPDSMIGGKNVYDVRKQIGAQLAREAPIQADMIVPVPDSGVPAAIGYAEEARTPFELGIIRAHYRGRTFIEPTDHIRHLGVRLKHSANTGYIKGKRIVLVDDSIVRGTTSLKIVEMMRNAGASEVHMRISSPPTTDSCFYGIDTPKREKLMAARMSVAEMAKEINVDSLAFISHDGLYQAVLGQARNAAEAQYCDACFTGEYPIPLTDHEGGSAAAQLSLLAEQD